METKEKIKIDFFSTSTADFLKDLEDTAEKHDKKMDTTKAEMMAWAMNNPKKLKFIVVFAIFFAIVGFIFTCVISIIYWMYSLLTLATLFIGTKTYQYIKSKTKKQ